MQVKLNKVFPLNGPVDVAWRLLQDIELVAGCMPGAEITDKIDDNHYQGKVKVKLGPVVMAFSGDIEVTETNAAEHKVRLLASGKDSKGTSTASMDLTAFTRPAEATNCELVGDAQVIVNGKLANFGGRMMTQVADQILQQFADNFANRLDDAKIADTKIADATDPDPKLGVQDEVKASQSNEINGFRFIWNLVCAYFKRLFTKTT